MFVGFKQAAALSRVDSNLDQEVVYMLNSAPYGLVTCVVVLSLPQAPLVWRC